MEILTIHIFLLPYVPQLLTTDVLFDLYIKSNRSYQIRDSIKCCEMKIQNPLKSIHKKINKSVADYVLASYQERLAMINQLEPEFQNKSDAELQSISRSIKEKAKSNIPLDTLLVEAFALVREVCKRQLNMRPYDVQLIAAMVLHEGKLAEMKTGEGKTLAAVMPVYLNALKGAGVHILTFNDYLAKRDAEWMAPVYRFLGLSVGYIQQNSSLEEKQKAYNCEITYATAKEVGFDFLRTFIAYQPNEIISRSFHFAIVDEADAILIDEARNPLVLAGNLTETDLDLYQIASFVANLKMTEDYTLDDYSRNVFLTDQGIEKAEKHFSVQTLYTSSGQELLAAINIAIHAKVLLHRDIDYVVKDRKVKLIDEFTGRIVEDRKWQNGLQMAVEAKENLEIQSEGIILGSITLQHFMQQYPKIAGMTATAMESAEEFNKFYKLQTIAIPPNIRCKRIDYPDLIFSHKIAKDNALLREIIEVHQSARPILIGTSTVKESESLAKMLESNNIAFQVLNAKNDELEAEIIANAGALRAVTISTNMAGRGTDIVLGGKEGKQKEEVLKLGGLYVIGTNRHESLRIDNQLRGRAGRQGDPGASRFFISFEDDLMIKYKLKELFPKTYQSKQQPEPIELPIIRKRIGLAQEIIEGQMFEMRETLYEYSKFIEKQRIIFQNERQHILFQNNFHLKNEFEELVILEIDSTLKNYILFLYDKLWARHLQYITELKDGIHLVRLGGRNPLRYFHEKTDEHFGEILEQLQTKVLAIINSKEPELIVSNIEKPSSTWTYIISDNPFGNQLGIMLGDSSNIGMQVDFFSAPLLFIAGLISRIKQKRRYKSTKK